MGIQTLALPTCSELCSLYLPQGCGNSHLAFSQGPLLYHSSSPNQTPSPVWCVRLPSHHPELLPGPTALLRWLLLKEAGVGKEGVSPLNHGPIPIPQVGKLRSLLTAAQLVRAQSLCPSLVPRQMCSGHQEQGHRSPASFSQSRTSPLPKDSCSGWPPRAHKCQRSRPTAPPLSQVS